MYIILSCLIKLAFFFNFVCFGTAEGFTRQPESEEILTEKHLNSMFGLAKDPDLTRKT